MDYGAKQSISGGGGGLKLMSAGAQHLIPATDASCTPEVVVVQRKSGDPIGIPALPPKPYCGATSPLPQSRSRPITSGSEISDEEDPEMEHGRSMSNPGDEKRVRR
jgi:hypothetical protein